MPFSGQKLRDVRKAAGVSRADLAAKAGTTHQYISHLENGVKGNPTYDLVEMLAKALGVDCRAFADDEETPAAPPPASPEKPPSRGKKGTGK